MRDGSYCEPLGLDYEAMRAKTTKEKVIVAAYAIGEGAVYFAVLYAIHEQPVNFGRIS